MILGRKVALSDLCYGKTSLTGVQRRQMAVGDIRELAMRQGLEASRRQKSDLTTAQNVQMIGCGDNWIKGKEGEGGELGKQQVVGCLLWAVHRGQPIDRD